VVRGIWWAGGQGGRVRHPGARGEVYRPNRRLMVECRGSSAGDRGSSAATSIGRL